MRYGRLLIYTLIFCFLATFMAGQVLAQTNSVADIQTGWLVKNKKYAEVFYVDANKMLRWINNEATAKKQFGVGWQKLIKEYDDLSTAGLKFGNMIKLSDPLVSNDPSTATSDLWMVFDQLVGLIPFQNRKCLTFRRMF